VNEPTLEELAARAKGGHAADFDQLADRVRQPLHSFLVKRVASPADADDLVQETLLRAYQNLDRYDPKRPFRTWLFTIGKRLAVNHGSSLRRRQDLNEKAGDATPESTSPSASESLEAEALWQTARLVLSDEQYHGLWLRYAQSCSVKETATELKRSTVATKVLLYRARKRLLMELS
jgi:RNA polymerase sigma-70 factor (ECF subfamily)